jgi:hypothetical protein
VNPDHGAAAIAIAPERTQDDSVQPATCGTGAPATRPHRSSAQQAREATHRPGPG